MIKRNFRIDNVTKERNLITIGWNNRALNTEGPIVVRTSAHLR